MSADQELDPAVLTSLFEAMPVGMTIMEFPTDNPNDGYLLAANPAAAAHLGFDPSEFIGRSRNDILTSSGQATTFSADLADESTRMSYEVATTGVGKQLPAYEVPEGPGKGIYRSGLFALGHRRMASLFQRIDKEVESKRALEWAVHSLESSQAELSRFAGSVAHDLKNPLAGIRGQAELLRMVGGDLPPLAAESVDRIMDLTDRSDTMIADLLTYSRQPHEQSSERVDVAEVVDWADAILDDRVMAYGAVIHATDLPSVRGNPSALRQVFLNLLSNSLRYQHPHRRLRNNVIGSATEDQHIVHVADNGIGIPEEIREKVFGWGFRSGADVSSDGSGIGLAACRGVMVNLGGSIQVVGTDDNIGTTVELRFPR